MEKRQRNMEGKVYQHHILGTVKTIRQSNYRKGCLRNILIETEEGTLYIIPQRSLRKISKEDKDVKSRPIKAVDER